MSSPSSVSLVSPQSAAAAAEEQRIIKDLNARMAELICRHVGETCDQPTAIDELLFFRRDTLTEPDICLVEPSVVMVMQGRKIMHSGEQSLHYDTDQFLVTSLDLPASSQVIEASPERPCVGVVLKLDLQLIAELAATNARPPARNTDAAGSDKGIGLWLSPVNARIVEPVQRLLMLLDEPDAIDVLAPMIKREIHYRLLQSPQAHRLCQIAAVESQGFRIAKAIDWLKVNYTRAFRIDDLASRVQMSTPTFHHHFRQLTGMSPLQYQKWLRLNEARRIMLNDHFDASTAAYEVGYESPSQFSREYSRLFGEPPRRDIERLRRAAASA